MAQEKGRILVIDDDEKITAFLRRGLAYEGYTVSTAKNGTEGLAQARDAPPDVVVLDVMMPGMDGMAVCRRLRGGDERLPIIMLTARDEVSDRVAGLDSGADDYLVKPFAFEELLARIRARLRGRETQANTVLRHEDLRLDTSTRFAHRGERSISLSTTEYELLAFLLSRPRQVLTRQLIMDRVWGYDYMGDSNVLEVYIRYLRTKLEEGGEPRLIQTVRGTGYVLRRDSE